MLRVRATFRNAPTILAGMTSIVAFCLALGGLEPRQASAGCGDYLLHERRTQFLNELAERGGAEGETHSERSAPNGPLRSGCSGRECSPAPAPATRSTPLRTTPRLEATVLRGLALAIAQGKSFAPQPNHVPPGVQPGRVFRPPRNRVDSLLGS